MSQIILSEDQVKELAEYLLGTCNSIYDGFAMIGVDKDRVAAQSFDAIDAQIFLCDTCGWWYPESENSGQQTCTDCNEQEIEEDEEYIEDDFEDKDFEDGGEA